MYAMATENQGSNSAVPTSSDAIFFLGALFGTCDYVLVRPVEAWIEGSRRLSRVVYQAQCWPQAAMLAIEVSWDTLMAIS
jgi:hypothetical protein